ncbi:type I-E CRISPR-associated protein Cse2/CasB [Bradymonas sediminis]|uniref:Type I-E CRISPR-associated protein Cse2/CasB n=1 Tax=Bradymonas sediminis TaxID=1548548 RepID=A0A2Z4FH77_9DELT|nr:type I-E CRISPR-associated protein Cse2/CasB [Bradymonas sediminis]AWV88250.1 type I-E CRISPR-associated protein Cse2/CasB [Bradymonas sediminis]TDP77373.1 CRISPR system Cascade subunit CasB [Bradymonas sediminis]
MSNSQGPEALEISETPDGEKTLRSVLGAIAAAFERNAQGQRGGLSNGDMAELRRISPDKPYTPALWRILLDFVPDGWVAGPDRDQKERQWATLLMAMAICAGQHDPYKRLGSALAEAGWSELRFVRLLRARDARLEAEVRRLSQYLSSKGTPANFGDLAQLLFHQDGELAENRRRQIARSYYRALHSLESK